MPPTKDTNVGRASRAPAQTKTTRTATRSTRARREAAGAETPSYDRPSKADKRGNFEPRSGLDPTIDASAGEKAATQQREVATA